MPQDGVEEDSRSMGQRRQRTPELIIRKLREGERLLGQGQKLPEVFKHASWYRWRNQYGAMRATTPGVSRSWEGKRAVEEDGR
jgi:hypothetical protein